MKTFSLIAHCLIVLGFVLMAIAMGFVFLGQALHGVN